jgi:hypothetical protein
MAESDIRAEGRMLQGLETIIGRTVERSIKRDTAAPLTVAFEIRKAIAMCSLSSHPQRV